MTDQHNQQIHLRYKLSDDEICKAFLLVLKKRSDRSRNLMGISLFLIAVALVISYAFFPTHLEYSMLAFCTVTVMFLIFWYPNAKAKRQAKKVSRIKGTYDVTFYADGFLQAKDQPKAALNGDKGARAFETEDLFVIRPDQTHTFVLPKRIINSRDQATIRQTLDCSLEKFITVAQSK